MDECTKGKYMSTYHHGQRLLYAPPYLPPNREYHKYIGTVCTYSRENGPYNAWVRFNLDGTVRTVDINNIKPLTDHDEWMEILKKPKNLTNETKCSTIIE